MYLNLVVGNKIHTVVFMKKYQALLISTCAYLPVIFAAEKEDNFDDEQPGYNVKIAKVDVSQQKSEKGVGNPPGGPELQENNDGASLADDLLSHKKVEEKQDFDFDYSQKNPRKTMRLSLEIEASDLRSFAPKAVGGYIRFFFLDVPDKEIGRLGFGKLVKNNRISIADAAVIPDGQFKIGYDFRTASGDVLGEFHWFCNSFENPEGQINPIGTYVQKLDTSTIRIRNNINAIRLKAFNGGQEKNDPFIRIGFVAARYSEGQPLYKAIEEPKLAPIGTMFNDLGLIQAAIKKFGHGEVAAKVASDDDSSLGASNYCMMGEVIELPDYSVTIAGEYCMRAQEKYGRMVTKDDASQLIALLRNYGVVTKATADELADYLGLK